jgi:hypothetical protein
MTGNDKKYFYITENADSVNADLTAKGIQHYWGAMPGTESTTHPGLPKYLMVVNWSGQSLQEKLSFEKSEHVVPLPYSKSRRPTHPRAVAFLQSACPHITAEDHTHDIVEKLSEHTGWGGWWHHL